MSANGFLLYQREENLHINAQERVKNYNEFTEELPPEDRKTQADRCMNCGIPFCGAGVAIKGITIGCPLHNYVPEWNKLISLGLFEEAFHRLELTAPFPEFTGRVCPALCEVGCTLNIHEKPVTIRDNERFLIEQAFQNHWIKPAKILERKNERIAVIGSGPAGLEVANELNKLGYQIEVFERNDRFGGLLMYGIPNMKLDKKVVMRRLKLMEEEEIRFTANFDAVKQKDKLSSFDAICFATGAPKPRGLNALNDQVKGIVYAVDYLKENTKSILDTKKMALTAKDKRVVIVGGGDTGNDCIGTAFRQHAASVCNIEIMPKKNTERTNQWPEWPNSLKTEYGAEEAIALTGLDIRHYAVKIKEVIGKDFVTAIKVVDLKWFYQNGKYVNSEIEGTERIIPCDLIIIASGFLGTENSLVDAFDLPLTPRGNIDAKNYHIKDNLFCCGDAYTGQSLVVKAISSAKACSLIINEYFVKK